MLYQTYQTQSDWMKPLRTWARISNSLIPEDTWLPDFRPVARRVAAALEAFALGEVTHRRPPWRIDRVLVKDQWVPVVEDVVLATPFATLLRFRKPDSNSQPKVLVVAPMSGHFATLLRDTVRTVLQDHDVYVTDWHNMRDVPLEAGRFGLDEYTQHLIDFLTAIGPHANLIAVCQPCVASLAAVSVMSEDDHPATPASMTLMAGPIDCRVGPTRVNTMATSKPIDWFERHVISRVPLRHRGGGRRVYPGFLQLSAFMNMNRERHVDAFMTFRRHLAEGDIAQADVIRHFYDEYMAVADLSADFYLETVNLIFQRYALPKGELTFRGRPIVPAAIRRTALLTVEGERDDICSVGQTLAAQDLTSSLRPWMRTHLVEPKVGHYGVFAGKRWQRHIYPQVRNVIHVSQ